MSWLQVKKKKNNRQTIAHKTQHIKLKPKQKKLQFWGLSKFLQKGKQILLQIWHPSLFSPFDFVYSRFFEFPLFVQIDCVHCGFFYSAF